MEKIDKLEKQKHYIKIPREIIEDSIKHSEKLLVYIYMYLHKSMFNSVNFSVNSIMQFYNIAARNLDAPKIYDEVVLIIKKYKVDNPINSNTNKTLKNSILHTVVFNEEYFKPKGSFAMIEINELFDIVHFKSKVSTKRILLFLSWYRVNMNRRDKKMHDSIDYKPEVWFFYAKKVCTRLSMCEDTFKKVITTLEEIDIIKTKRLPNYKLTNNTALTSWRSGYLLVADCRPFIDSRYTWEDELEHGVLYVNKIANKHKDVFDERNLNQ